MKWSSGFSDADMSDDIMQFPCELPIKVFGRNSDEFPETAFQIVKDHVESLQRSDMSQQSSREGRFLSLTIRVRAQSRAQVDAIYRALTASETVLMVI